MSLSVFLFTDSNLPVMLVFSLLINISEDFHVHRSITNSWYGYSHTFLTKPNFSNVKRTRPWKKLNFPMENEPECALFSQRSCTDSSVMLPNPPLPSEQDSNSSL